MKQMSFFDTEGKSQLRLRGKFATKKQVERDKEAKRVDLVMQQNTFLKAQNEMYFRMMKAFTTQIRLLNERVRELSKK